MHGKYAMRIAFALLLVLHAALHLLGFLKSWRLLPLPQLSGRTLVPLSSGLTRAFGLGWLLAALLLTCAAALWSMRHEAWWIVASVGVLLSQGLIVLQWQDAKAGTLANLAVVVVIALSIASLRLQHRVEKALRLLLASAPSANAVAQIDSELRLEAASASARQLEAYDDER